MSVAERFSAASANPPLSQLTGAAQAELGGVLLRATCFEDLPGKWQAALLAAEAPASPQLAPAARACCCGGQANPVAETTISVRASRLTPLPGSVHSPLGVSAASDQ